MSTVSSIGFRGETTNPCPSGQCPPAQITSTNFRGYPADSFESSEKKKGHPVLAIGLTLFTAGALIAGMGYAHKAGWISKMKDGKFKNFSEKVTGTCHDWCSKTKGFGEKCWNTVKGWFSKKS